MSKTPLISIITVNLNDVKGMEKTLKSVFEQTWKTFEFIVIDGGSKDGSKELIESHDDKIDYWVSEPDKGIYNAMNKGIEISTGQYLLFLNSGDVFSANNVLENSFEHLTGEAIIYFNVFVDENDHLNLIEYPDELRFSDLLYGTLCHQSVFIRKELFQQVGRYDESLKIVSDWKFFILSLFKENCTYKKVDHQLSIVNSEGISALAENESLILKEREKVLQNHFKAFLKEVEELNNLKFVVENLKKSRKINLLVRLGLLKKF
ncbi:glycosyltransferase family 2 protein [Christiangramia forsetii]|uniref:Colanic acid biosynthesis glycosyl transferase n=2 Tax=Christiangramia forsetii TaxID=411153 RepID=A0LYU5_CHRFK|nr:glycosyltransferase family 2 protein [Christiangramia forsetii]GGG33331.1 glycosyl transferase [Christiangramia forsetii]CAL65540.1 colanic acid biosynthesis glycosyl transferase [Christiangramia forsetii KT0803]